MKTFKELIPEFMAPVTSGKRMMFGASFGEHAQFMTGITSEIFYNNPDANIEVILLASEYFGVPAGGSGSWDIYNFEARAIGQSVKVAKYGLPDVDYTDPLCKTEADMGKIKWPSANPLDTGRFPLVIKGFELMEKYTGAPPGLFNAAVSSFTLACELYSFEGFMRIIKKQPALAHKIMEKITYDIHVPLVKAVAAKYPGILFKSSDAWEMIPNISPKIEREFVWPYYDKLIEATKNDNVKVGYWSTYGESQMPDPSKYLEEKSKYNGIISYPGTENVPRDVYVDTANRLGLNLMTMVLSTKINEGPPEAIIEFIRGIAKDMRCKAKKFSWLGGSTFGTKPEHVMAMLAAGYAFSVNPCPSPEEMDKIKVTVPVLPESFGDFCRRHVKENPNGYTFNWLDKAEFYGD
ncbi:MAG: hypothetical protein LBH43_01135 [Treponema sp.]|jgi:hypothetical protein|nr:hypothetical protein [Treponema sp.]